MLRPHPVFGPYAWAFLVDLPPALIQLTPAYEMPHVARVMERARNSPIPTRPIPLPPVPRIGAFKRPPVSESTITEIMAGLKRQQPKV